MENNGVLYFLLGTFAFIISLSLFVSFVKPTLDLPKVRTEKVPDFRFEGVRLTHFEDGKAMWEISAKQADVSNEDQMVVLKQASGNIYAGNDNSIAFDSTRIHYYLDKHVMQFKKADARFFIDQKQYALYATVLHWDSDLNHFIGKQGVLLSGNSAAISGQTFFADLPISKMRVVSNVKAELKITK